MNIGLDIMGGDHAPDATIRGAMLAHKEISETDRLFLFGDEEMIRIVTGQRAVTLDRPVVVRTSSPFTRSASWRSPVARVRVVTSAPASAAASSII